MEVSTMYMLKADKNKILKNKISGAKTTSVLLKSGENMEDWEEIEIMEDENNG